ncbi:MAG: hypothetical protein AAFZ91_11085 [Pseudomonadota bacterium]
MSESGFLHGIHIPDLGLGAGIALWSFRACARGGAKCCSIIRGFEKTFGGDGPNALASMLEFTKSLGNDGRRSILLATPGCARVTADELSVVACLSAAQSKDSALCDAHLSWLFAGAPPQDFSETVFHIADYFSAYGLRVIAPELELRGAPSATHRLKVISVGHA